MFGKVAKLPNYSWYANWVNSQLPVSISFIRVVSEYALAVGGEGWHFTSESPARILDAHGKLLMGEADFWNADRSEEVFLGLVGEQIIEAKALERTSERDLMLELSNGSVIENFDTLFADSWVLQINGRERPDDWSASWSWKPLNDRPNERCRAGTPIIYHADSAVRESCGRDRTAFWHGYTPPSGALADISNDPHSLSCQEWNADDWSLRTICAWRLFDENGAPVTSSDVHESGDLDLIVGMRPVAFETSGCYGRDLSVRFDSGWNLELFTDGLFSTWHLNVRGTQYCGLDRCPHDQH